MGKYDEARQAVLDAAMKLYNEGYLTARGGNVSMKIEGEETVAVTPSQVDYTIMKNSDICVVDFDLKPVEDNCLKPSVETAMHISCYKNRKDVNAIVHTHQIFASVFACISEPVPALFDEVSIEIGTKIEIVPYGLSGSPQLIENITASIDSRMNAYLLKNHGALTFGITLEKAVSNAMLLEKGAKVYYYGLTTGKEVTTLPQEIQDLLLKIMKGKQDAEIQRKEEAKQHYK